MPGFAVGDIWRQEQTRVALAFEIYRDQSRSNGFFRRCVRTVKLFALDGKTGRGLNALGWGKGEFDNTCFGVFRDLSGSIAVQRPVSTVCLTVSVRCAAQNARQNKRLSGREMIEWE
jgi:hypothetical protein